MGDEVLGFFLIYTQVQEQLVFCSILITIAAESIIHDARGIMKKYTVFIHDIS